MDNNGKNSAFPLVIISLVIALLLVGAYWFGRNSISNNLSKVADIVTKEISENEKPKTEEKSKTENNLVSGSETQSSGSGSGESIVKEENNEEVIETLKLLFAQKYGKKVEDAIVNISQREGDYLVGGIKFSGDISGGYVLAAKVNGVWKIVFDGNGNVTCTVVDEVNFPASLVSECWDEQKMDVKYRTIDTSLQK